MKKLTLLLTAALSLIPATERKLSALDFDAGTGMSISEAVGELKARSAAVRAPAVSSASVSSSLARFWEDLKKDTMEDACDNVELKLNEGVKVANIAGVEGDFKRYMRKSPEGRLALIDEVKLNLSLGISQELLNSPELGVLSVGMTGLLEGKSQVIRPLQSDSSCRELKTLAKLSQVKTVLPARISRIAAMKNGEIWKLPLTLRMGFSSGVGVAIREFLNISISAGKSNENKPSVTLYRIDYNKLRLRLRLDHVAVRSAGASVSSAEIPVADIGLINAENILAREINKGWAKEINKYIALKLSFAHSRSTGKKLLLEFVLNPDSPEQMASLEEFLRGDFGLVKRFMEMNLRFNDFSEADDISGGLSDIDGAEQQVGQSLNSAASFSGSNLSHGQSDTFHMQVPVLHTRDDAWSSSYNRYQSQADSGEVLHVQQQGRTSTGNSLNIPLVGTVVKYSSQKNVYVVNREVADGQATRPGMMYQQNEGFLRNSDGTARQMIEKANGMLRYVGVDGSRRGELIPADEIFPALPEPSDPGQLAQSKVYGSALMSFKLLINERGVNGIIFAPAQAILKAYLNMMRETEAAVIDKVLDLFTVNEEGEVGFDHKAAQKRLGTAFLTGCDNGTNPLDIVRTLAKAATQVIGDLASVKGASNWKERSGRLSRVAAGDSRSGLGYEDFMKVVLQLVSPEDVSAEVYLHTDKKVKGEADLTRTYRFFNGRDNNFDSALSEVSQAQERFAEPSLLTD